MTKYQDLPEGERRRLSAIAHGPTRIAEIQQALRRFETGLIKEEPKKPETKTSKTPRKKLQTLRLDVAVLDHYKATGPGWMTRINDILKRHMEAS